MDQVGSRPAKGACPLKATRLGETSTFRRTARQRDRNTGQTGFVPRPNLPLCEQDKDIIDYSKLLSGCQVLLGWVCGGIFAT